MGDSSTHQPTQEDFNKLFSIVNQSMPIYEHPKGDPDKSWISNLLMEEIGTNKEYSNLLAQQFLNRDVVLSKELGTVAPSDQGVIIGRKFHPFNFHEVLLFKTSNVHHSRCINTKKAATVGLGFADATGKPMDKVSDILNPLCDIDFQTVLDTACEDYWNVGNGRIEVVREKPGGKITGLHSLAAQDCFVFLENARYDRHWEIVSPEGVAMRRFARFGDMQGFLDRLPSLGAIEGTLGMPQPVSITSPTKGVSEVIEFRMPTSYSRWYGFPDWLAAVAKIELVQCRDQFEFDFYNNRGVPEMAIWLLGGQVGKEDFKKIESVLKAGTGRGRSHKSLISNLADPNLKVQVDKLAMEGSRKGDDSGGSSDTNALDIVSAHGVPPILAGIQVPGKLGATNEIPNAIMAFQSLVISQAQHRFRQVLGSTLGNSDLNGGLDLTADDFTFRKITDEINAATAAMAASAQRDSSESAAWGADAGSAPAAGPLDTMSRMRQPLPQAAAQGRDLSAGLRKAVDRLVARRKLSVNIKKAIMEYVAKMAP